MILSGCTEVQTIYEARYVLDYNPSINYSQLMKILESESEIIKVDGEKITLSDDDYNETIQNASYDIYGEVKKSDSKIAFYFSIATVSELESSYSASFGYSTYEKQITTRIGLFYGNKNDNYNNDLKATARWFKEIIEEEFNQTPINEKFIDLSGEIS